MAPPRFDTSDTAPSAPAGEREVRRRTIGRLGGLLICLGALLAALNSLTLDPTPAGWVFAVIGLALATGLACLVVDWERLPPVWLHAVPIAATLEVTAVAWGSGLRGTLYAWLYMVIGMMVAYVSRSRRVAGAYLALVAVCLAAPIVDPFVDSDDALRSILVGIPSVALVMALVTYLRERAEAGNRAYQELARIDPLTGVGNYRTLHERLDYEIARHLRHGRKFAVMLLDLDGFKTVNETYGHLEGDRVLREVGGALSTTVRDQDTVARQGGDEFSVLAPETAEPEIPALVRRINSALASIEIDGNPLTATVGWAIFPDDGETPQTLLGSADSALFTRKLEPAERQAGARAGSLRPVHDRGGAAASAGGA
jgi:diguanylate cyclase (GGDEF)-like protein